MHIQILALFLPSEQKAVVSNTEHTLEVMHLTRQQPYKQQTEETAKGLTERGLTQIPCYKGKLRKRHW